MGVNAAAGGYTALLTSLSAVSAGYASLQAIQSSGASFGNLILNASGGNIGIATAAPGFTLEVAGTAGKPGGGSWSASSDIRLKKNIKPLENALEKMLQLRPVTFQWREPEKEGNMTGTYMGMIAQEVEKVFPEWVGTKENGYKTLTFIGFEALTTEAVRELKSENDELRQELNDLRELVQMLLAEQEEKSAKTLTLTK